MEQIARTEFIVDGNYARMGFSHLVDRGIEGRFYSMDFIALTEYLATVVVQYTGVRYVYSEKKVFMGSNATLDDKNRAFNRTLEDAGFTRSTYTLRSPEQQAHRPAKQEKIGITP